jgi:Zn-dependent protease
VSSLTPELLRNYSEELDRLASEAKALEGTGDLRRARERWLSGLHLLPRTSKQYEWIVQHAKDLSTTADKAQIPESSENKWAKRLGPVGPIAILLVKAKTVLFALFKLKFLLSFAAFIGIYWAAWGMKFGIGFAVLILLHEMGHFIDIKRRGLPAEMPVFLPGLGAYVRWQALGVPLETRAAISLAGPLTGLLTALACAALWSQTGNPLWAALARAGAILNLLNLIPVWILDGGQAVVALSKMERIILLTACLTLWLVLGENMFFLVALGAAYQVFFAKDLPPHPSRATIIYYLAVLMALGGIIRLLPGTGLGLR